MWRPPRIHAGTPTSLASDAEKTVQNHGNAWSCKSAEVQRVTEIGCMQGAIEPQHWPELNKAFQRLSCLECLWLDMEEPENVSKLIEQVAIQRQEFADSLQLNRETLMQLSSSLQDLNNSRQSECGSNVMIGPDEVQDCSRALMTQVMEEEKFHFHYKHREHQGFAVHIAVLHPNGEPTLRRLLDLQVDVRKFCTSVSRNRTTLAEPLHLAAGCGHEAAVSLLLQAKVDVDVKSYLDAGKDTSKKGIKMDLWRDIMKRVPVATPLTHGPEHRIRHYTPLHEACFFQQEKMVKLLIEHRAYVDSTNTYGMTSLHWTARQGNVDIAELLVQAEANLTLKDNEGKTALEIAVESATFPPGGLCMLMQQQISDIMTVAKSAPNVAKELLRDPDEGGAISASWRERLLEDHVTVEQWVELMELAPQVAEDVLEAVSMTPIVENPDHHPLRRQASLLEQERMRCKYTKDDTWSYNVSKGNGPKWHDTLIPNISNYENRALRNMQRALGWERKVVPVRVKIVKIPGLMNRQVLRALKDTYHLGLFTNLAAQAIIECAWDTVVKRFYYVHLLYRTLEIGVLFGWIFLHLEPGLFRQASWSWLLVCSSREMFYELCEIRGYLKMRQGYFVSAYLMDAKNMFDLSSILMLLVLTSQTWEHQELGGNLPLLALVVASRWVQLVYTLRAFPFVGQKVLPIIQSFKPLAGIFFITIFIFMGFLHAFLVLDSDMRGSSDESGWVVFTSAFRFLFLGDGDGVDIILGLGNRNQHHGDLVTRGFFVLAVIGFSILILNLFIAGAHQAYEDAHVNAETRFFQERADICLQCLFRPTWPCNCRRRLAFTFIFVGVLPLWLLGLLYLPWHPALASAFLFIMSIVGDSVLMQHAWTSQSRAVPASRHEADSPISFRPTPHLNSAENMTVECAECDRTSQLGGLLNRVGMSKSSSLIGMEQKYLWFCYRSECEDVDGSGALHSSHKAQDVVASQRQLGRMLRRETEVLQKSMDLKLEKVNADMQSLGQDLGGRLERLEQSIGQLVTFMERVGVKEQEEAPLPEGWASARAPNGQTYYYNRELRKRQWEKPAASLAIPGAPSRACPGSPTRPSPAGTHQVHRGHGSPGLRSHESLPPLSTIRAPCTAPISHEGTKRSKLDPGSVGAPEMASLAQGIAACAQILEHPSDASDANCTDVKCESSGAEAGHAKTLGAEVPASGGAAARAHRRPEELRPPELS